MVSSYLQVHNQTFKKGVAGRGCFLKKITILRNVDFQAIMVSVT